MSGGIMIGVPEGLEEALMAHMMGREDENHNFKTGEMYLEGWRAMVAAETDIHFLVPYVEMIRSDSDSGEDANPFFDAVFDRALELIGQRWDSTAISVLYGVANLKSGHARYAQRVAEHFAPITPDQALYLARSVQITKFGGRAAREAIYNAVRPDLRDAYDRFIPALYES